MKKELVETLRHMQSHPTTGTPHNQQVISAQIETIFAIDDLKDEIQTLNKILVNSERQNQKLELSNYKLQLMMLILTSIAVGIAAFPIVEYLYKTISPHMNQALRQINISVIFVNAISFMIPIIVSLFVIFLTFKFGRRYSDAIKLKDSITIVLKDKEGRIKEVRHIGS